jgi:phosphohistidine phosphatase
MKRLFLLRHAKAAPDDAGGDHARPLAARGRSDAPRMAAEIARRGFVPEVILCSTAQRTLETLELVLPAFAVAPEVRMQDALYHAEPEAILMQVAEMADDVGAVMVIGHNPGLEMLVAALPQSAHGGRRGLDDFPTCAFAAFEIDAPAWPFAVIGDWTLLDRFAPADL